MKTEEKIDMILNEGQLSWADTDDLAKKLNAKYSDLKKEKVMLHSKNSASVNQNVFHMTYVFKNIKELQHFSDVMKKRFMNFKADPDGLEVKVWF